MTVAPRAVAVGFLCSLSRPGRRLDLLPRDAGFRALEERDRRLVTELVYGVLRNRAALDCYLEQISEKPLKKLDTAVLWILRVALYQVEFLRVPDRAAVYEAVELCRQFRKASAAGFVNALLRRFLQRRPRLPEGDTEAALAVRYSHPQWLIARYLQRYGKEQTLALLQRNNTPPLPFVRVNTFKISVEELCQRLRERRISCEPYPSLSGCLVIRSPNLPEQDFYRQGLCFLMDVASQEIAWLSDMRGLKMLGDFCAAPGGKALVMASRKDREALLVCCDASQGRLQDTRRRAQLYQAPGLCLVRADLTAPAPFHRRFDFVLLDVPCSGLGTLRSNPDIRWRVQEKDLPVFHRKQVKLLRHAFETVLPGGEVLYSTCSTEPEENEDVVHEFLAAEARAELVGEFHRTFPHTHAGECFFAARVRHR